MSKAKQRCGLQGSRSPSQMLMLSNSAINGLRRAWFRAAGDLATNLVQMLAAGLGMMIFLATSTEALSAPQIRCTFFASPRRRTASDLSGKR